MASTVTRSTTHGFARRIVVATALAASVLVAGGATPAEAVPFEPLPAPQRIVDTRTNGTTIDGVSQGSGPVDAESTLTVAVAGRAGIASTATSVVLNVTAVGPQSNGFFTIFPCGTRPNASNLNFRSGQNIANTVFATLDESGNVCVYSSAASNIIIDVAGSMPAAAFNGLPEPRRIADTRPRGETVDGDLQQGGPIDGGTRLEVQVRGRAGVDDDATTAVLNVTTAGASANGFFTVFPCTSDVPTASNLNYQAGQIIANAVVARLSDDGTVCVFTSVDSNVIVDVAGTLAADTFTALDTPQRIADTRLAGMTTDLIYDAIGTRNGGETMSLPVAGRAGVPADATGVVLNVTSVRPLEGGFITTHPRNSDRPNASNLNYGAGQNVANAVVARIGGDGHICVYNSAPTGMIIDVAGYLTGPIPGNDGVNCPDDEQRLNSGLRYDPGVYFVNSEIPAGRYEIADADTDCEYGRFDQEIDSDVEPLGFEFGTAPGNRLLVDIRPSDVDFGFTDACGEMRPYQKSTELASTIRPGSSVVGDHVLPGVYSATVSENCFLYTAESFDGSFGSILTLSFIEAADLVDGNEFFLVLADWDLAVYTSQECGNWTREADQKPTEGARQLLLGIDTMPARTATL